MKMTERVGLLTVLASLLVGAGAGVVSSVMTSRALEDYAASLLGDRGFTALEPRKPASNPLDYDDAIRRVRESQSRTLAVITPKTVDGTVGDRWIGPDDAIGYGVVVSANGWVLTTTYELEGVANPVTGAEVWIRGTRYAIGEVARDELTPYALLKLVEANGLSPIGFGASEDALSGDMIFLVSSINAVIPATIENSEALSVQGPQTAETFATVWNVAEDIDERGPVLSTTGDLMAFAVPDAQAVPFHHAASFVQETIRSGAPAHAALGAYVVDLSHVYNVDAQLRQGLATGALVFAPTGKLAVPAKTPAAQGGVLADDIITAVEGEPITLTQSLAEILSTYDPGQTVRLTVLRGGAPIEVPVVLGDLAALVY